MTIGTQGLRHHKARPDMARPLKRLAERKDGSRLKQREPSFTWRSDPLRTKRSSAILYRFQFALEQCKHDNPHTRVAPSGRLRSGSGAQGYVVKECLCNSVIKARRAKNDLDLLSSERIASAAEICQRVTPKAVLGERQVAYRIQ